MVLVLGVLMGGIACAMLLVGGLSALQQAAVLGSVPFTFVIVGVAWCWIKALREKTVPARVPSPAHSSKVGSELGVGAAGPDEGRST